MKKSILSIIGVAALAAGCTSIDKTTVKNTINKEDVMAKMSLEDKAHFVIGTGMQGFSGDEAVIGATKNLVPGAAGTTYPFDSLGIPAIVLADGPAGLRIDATREGDSATYYCTHFPIGTLLASTWNTQLCVTRSADVTSSITLRIPSWQVRRLQPISRVSRRTM